MVTHIFSEEELKSFTLEQLRRLASYYKVDHNKRIGKDALIEKIYSLTTFGSPDYAGSEIQSDGLPPMSARVRRIYEQNKKKEGE